MDHLETAFPIPTLTLTQLANALFMREGSMLLELGFASPLAAHYAHAAAALGLRYEARIHI